MAKTAAQKIAEIKAKAEAEAAKLADEAKAELDAKWDEVVSHAKAALAELTDQYYDLGLTPKPNPFLGKARRQASRSGSSGQIRWPRSDEALGILGALKKSNGQTTAKATEGMDTDAASKAISNLTAKGWVEAKGGKLYLTDQTKTHEKYAEL